MNVCFVILLIFIALGCADLNSSKMTSFHNQNIPPVNAENSKTFDCNNPDGYSLVVVKDTSRDARHSGTLPRNLNIVGGDKIRTTIKIPTDTDAMGFSLRSAEKTREGFEITIDYGSRYYYRKQFNFICKENNFYLYKVKVESFDKHDSESMNNWRKEEIEIKPNLPVEKFLMTDYMAD
jgi:hypothetical protein